MIEHTVAAAGELILVMDWFGDELWITVPLDADPEVLEEVWPELPTPTREALKACGIHAKGFAAALTALAREHLADLDEHGPLRMRMTVDPGAHAKGKAAWTLTLF